MKICQKCKKRIESGNICRPCYKEGRINETVADDASDFVVGAIIGAALMSEESSSDVSSSCFV
jgi:hypothetical protein